MTQPLLIEIGVEELPALPLLRIVDAIESAWGLLLEEYRLACPFTFVYTPRRLVLRHEAIPTRQEDRNVELFGPPLTAALRDGTVTKAGEGFARKCGVSFETLQSVMHNGREVLYCQQRERGAETASVVQEMLERWIASMAFGKMMRWGDRSDEFIRPLRWLQVWLGDTSVPVSLYGVRSGDATYVHRMVSHDPVVVAQRENYEAILQEGGVVLDPAEREAMIRLQFEALESRDGIFIEQDADLLAEVVAITEYPQALLGSFDADFLRLPPEVIVTSMKEHQRYFPVFRQGKISNHFVVVSNAYTNDFSKVISGNERVLKPRLADALFFYENDLRRGLSTEGLEKVQFIDGLGTLADKIMREKRIAMRLLGLYGDRVEAQSGKSALEVEKLLDRAVGLAKADLMSEMVYEFTELQGLMGHYYAKALGEDPIICDAIREQYMPTGEGAALPGSLFSSLVAMAIKLDTLIGLFSVGKIPTGSKDPFALRRAVNGIIRIVTAQDLPFSLEDILLLLREGYAPFETERLSAFVLERLNKSLDANPSVISAVFASGEQDLNEIVKKVNALNQIVSSDLFKEQFSTFKRVANISADLSEDHTAHIDISLFSIEAETSLYTAYEKVCNMSFESYQQQLEALFGLKSELDRYFDEVLVNAKDPAISANRHALIASIYQAFKSIADIKEITI
jgi:glycyl-tRNA synthetase beta chain